MNFFKKAIRDFQSHKEILEVRHEGEDILSNLYSKIEGDVNSYLDESSCQHEKCTQEENPLLDLISNVLLGKNIEKYVDELLEEKGEI